MEVLFIVIAVVLIAAKGFRQVSKSEAIEGGGAFSENFPPMHFDVEEKKTVVETPKKEEVVEEKPAETFMTNHPKRTKEKFDARRAIIYSEILKPKFKEL